MTIRLSLIALATLLFITVLATLSSEAHAYSSGPAVEEEFVASRILATGPLNIVVFVVSER